jgi:hypothetical protein
MGILATPEFLARCGTARRYPVQANTNIGLPMTPLRNVADT